MARPQAILLIVVDTLRADHLPGWGYPLDTAPFLTQWGKEDCLSYPTTVTACPYTFPSIISILTGLYPDHHTTRFKQISPRLGDTDATLAEILQGVGYTTAAFVSSYVLRRETRINQGFAHYDDHMTQGEQNRPGELIRPGQATNEAFFAWLRRHEKESFFAFLHYFDVHGPYIRGTPFKQLFSPGLYGEPLPLSVVPDAYPYLGIPAYQALGSERDARSYFSSYDAGIRTADSLIRNVVERLQKMGIYDESLIVVTSDHGEAMGERGLFFFHGLSLSPEQILVPLLIKWPGGTHRGQRGPRIMSTTDIFPTILETAAWKGLERLPLDGEGWTPDAQQRLRPARAMNPHLEGTVAGNNVLVTRREHLPLDIKDFLDVPPARQEGTIPFPGKDLIPGRNISREIKELLKKKAKQPNAPGPGPNAGPSTAPLADNKSARLPGPATQVWSNGQRIN